MTYYFLGLPIVGIYCVTTTDPKAVAIDLGGAQIIQLPYDTYQTLRLTLNLPDIVCE